MASRSYVRDRVTTRWRPPDDPVQLRVRLVIQPLVALVGQQGGGVLHHYAEGAGVRQL